MSTPTVGRCVVEGLGSPELPEGRVWPELPEGRGWPEIPQGRGSFQLQGTRVVGCYQISLASPGGCETTPGENNKSGRVKTM